MVIYSKETKILIIPAGGSGGSGIIPTSGDCSEAIEQARTEGYNSGKQAQKAIDDAKITPTLTVIENGQYTANYGYKKVIVDVPQSGDCSEAIAIAYQSGYTAGRADCPDCPPCPPCDCTEAYNSGVTVGYNEGYTDGYAEGQADCPVCPPCDCTEAYQSGITTGVAQQKALLTSTAITTSGTYTRENGWNSVTVNISQKKQAIIGTIEATGVDLLYSYLDIDNCVGGMHTDWIYELDGFPNSGDSGLSMNVPAGTHTLNIYTDFPEDRIAIKNPTVGVWTSVQFWQL